MNWASPPYNTWGFRNTGIHPSVMVARGGKTFELPQKIDNSLEKLEFDYDGKKYSVMDALQADHTDGFLVIKDGNIFYERYFGDFTTHDHHLWASSTKSLIAMAVGILVDQGKLDVTKKIGDYIPELKGGVFENLTVQQVLNIVSAIDYSEDYADLKPGTVHLRVFSPPGFNAGVRSDAVRSCEERYLKRNPAFSA